MSKTYFAYHLTHVFGPFGLDSYYTNSEKPHEGDFIYVLSGDKDPQAAGVDYFLEGVFRIHRRHTGPWTLKSLNGTRKAYRLRLSLEPLRRPDTPIPLSSAPWYSREEAHRYFSSGQNFNPLPAGLDYKTRFDGLLAGYGSSRADDLLEDLAQIGREVPDETEREILAKARVGQGRFRAELVAAWGKGEACALTGLDIPEMLIASHIKPWRESSNRERLDPMNGLLLAAHADCLFDRYLMSFIEQRGTFRCVFHPRVRGKLSALGLTEGMELKTGQLGLSDEHRFRAYMAEHLRRHQALVIQDRPST